MNDKTCSLIDHFEGIEDPRVNRMKLHSLINIIMIALCAMIAGCDTSDELEIFGNSHLDRCTHRRATRGGGNLDVLIFDCYNLIVIRNWLISTHGFYGRPKLIKEKLCLK